ncbi:hypothetical protein [Inquilinus sp.]|uniref:hypothetical protein n=1 Tax=Inquilinus sp. TaxID=1932117 RepID=UPI003783FEC0
MLAHLGDAALDLLNVLRHLVGGRQQRQLHPQVVKILLRRLTLRRRLATLDDLLRQLALEQQGQPRRARDGGDPLAKIDSGLRRPGDRHPDLTSRRAGIDRTGGV